MLGEDKRIIKTKSLLKNTFIDILAKKPFEKITVREICEIAKTSRITFYAHYSDKYDLVDDISQDMVKEAKNEYQKLQTKNNLKQDPVLSYCNFWDCILKVYYSNLRLFSHTSSNENPYLNFSFYKYLLKYLEIHTQKRSEILKPKYSTKKIASFLCYGLWAFISEGQAESCSFEQVSREVREILQGIMRSEILTKNLEQDNK